MNGVTVSRLPSSDNDSLRRHRRLGARIEQPEIGLDHFGRPAFGLCFVGTAEDFRDIAVQNRIRHPSAMGDEEQSVGPQPLGPLARAVSGELGELGAQTGAAEGKRPARGSPRPVGEHGPFPDCAGEGVERAGRESCNQALATEISLRRAPPVPRGLGPDDAEASGAQRISLVDQAAPMIELDADAVAVNESRRVDDARGLVDPRIDHVAEARRRALEAQPVFRPDGAADGARNFDLGHRVRRRYERRQILQRLAIDRGGLGGAPGLQLDARHAALD